MSHSVASKAPDILRPPFALLTPRLLLLPTPLAIDCSAYLDMYARLHSSSDFCITAFGPDFTIQNWDIAERTAIVQREILSSWAVRGMGDFAIGLLPDTLTPKSSDPSSNSTYTMRTVEASLQDPWLDDMQWIGYVGVRDATTTSIPKFNPTFHANMMQTGQYPPWQNMIELRYGLDPCAWGKGFGTEAAQAIMDWCKGEKGGRRFIAESEKLNEGSKKILRKLGFVECELQYWGMTGTIEWEYPISATSSIISV